jgi:AAA15 family ATPase/GTPase
MHPRLTACFVGLFRDTQVNPRAAQLVFTTHDATLLDPILGDDTMRRDEVWFVEKQGDGGTTLYSLADFKPRKLENWERRYLAGGYGAIPLASEWEFRRAFDDDAAA